MHASYFAHEYFASVEFVPDSLRFGPFIIATANKMSPKASIIIPFFNREEFLAAAIESVIAQTEEDWELLLVDDGSTDQSGQIAKNFANKEQERIKLVNHPDRTNKGASAARNLGLEHAKGQYVTFLDSDDVLYPDSLEKELNVFARYPKLDAVCGTALVWYTWRGETDNWNKDFKIDLVLETGRAYEPPSLFLHNLNAGGRKPHFNATLISRAFLERVGAFEEEFKSVAEDQVLWAKVSLNGRIFVLDDVLAKYRQHPDSTCANLLRTGKDIDHWEKVFSWLEDYLNMNEISDAEIWGSLKGFRNRHKFERRIRVIKNLYRGMLPLHLRYRLRDYRTKLKELLAGSTHRHK